MGEPYVWASDTEHEVLDEMASMPVEMAPGHRLEDAGKAGAFDDLTLRAAARILRARSTRPNGLGLRAFCKVLTDTADRITEERSHG